MRGFNILAAIVLLLMYTLITEVNAGPHVCSDRLKNHFATKLTEFPLNPEDDINFLNYGDSCNLNSQLTFEKKLLQQFNKKTNDGSSNEEVILALDVLWNDARQNTVDGALGDRICNPRRLLSCHPTIKQCVCRPDFQLDPPYTQDFHKGITVHSETVETENFGKDRVEKVISCRATGNCQWRAPWLGFCHLLCVKDHFCIGVNTANSGGVASSERCVQCEPYTMKGLDKCTEEGARLSLEKKGPAHQHEDDLNGSNSLNCTRFMAAVLILIVLMV